MRKNQRNLSSWIFFLFLPTAGLIFAGHASAIAPAYYSWDWTIVKTGDVSDLTLALSESFVVNYTVTVEGTPTQLPGSALSSVDETVTVSDDRAGTLGTIIAAALETYTYSLTVGPYDSPGDYTFVNTASFITDDTPKSGSDSWTVTIHVPSPRPSVPEPLTALLLGGGLAGLWGIRKKVRKVTPA